MPNQNYRAQADEHLHGLHLSLLSRCQAAQGLCAENQRRQEDHRNLFTDQVRHISTGAESPGHISESECQ